MSESEKNEKNEKKKPKSKKFRYKKCLGICYPKTTNQNQVNSLYDYDDDDDREWQMSPFSNERYDLNEIQTLERKGVKAKQQLEALKKRLAAKNDPRPSSEENSAPQQKPKATTDTWQPPVRSPTDMNCSPEILYQPYGPLIAPFRSYARPYNSKSELYGYLGPSFYTAFRYKIPAPSMVPPIPCPESGPRMPPNLADLSHYAASYGNVYIPLGP